MKKAALFIAGALLSLSVSAQNNLLSNPSFEDGVPKVANSSRSTPGSWFAYFQAARGGITVEQVEGKQGKAIKVEVLKCEKPVWDNYIMQNVELTSGEYQLQFWAKAEQPAAERTALRFCIKPSTASYLDGFKAPWSPKKAIGTEWAQITHKFTVDQAQQGLDSDCKLIITFEEAGNTFYIDEVSLIKLK